MRGLNIVVLLVLMAVSLTGQERIVTLSYFTTPTIVETQVSGLTIGPVLSATPVPQHLINNSRPDLVATAGGRHLAWMAQVHDSTGLECSELVAVFDRRTRAVRAVPNLEIPACGVVKLVGDSRRTRFFLHRWAALFVPGVIGIIDERFTFQPLVMDFRIGTAFAYAPDVDRLFVTRIGTLADPTLHFAVLDGSTGQQIASFPLHTTRNDRYAQLAVTSDGRRVFFYDGRDGGETIRSFDGLTGAPIAVSPPIDLGQFWANRFELDEAKGLILVPHRKDASQGYAQQLLALDASTLATLGEGNPGGYAWFDTFQPIRGSASAVAYVLSTNLSSGSPSECLLWIDALDSAGALRARADIPQLAGVIRTPWYGCPAATTLLSPPNSPAALVASVEANRVILNWEIPANANDIQLEAGSVPNRADLTARIGPVVSHAVDAVPPGVYYVRVRAINEVGVSAPSNEVRVVVP